MRDGRRVTQTSVTVDRVEALLSSEGHVLLDRLAREDPAVIDSLRLGARCVSSSRRSWWRRR